MSTIHSLPHAEAGRPTVLCLHCSGGSGRQWRPLSTPLSQYFNFRAPDLLGYASPGSWRPGAMVSLDDEAERLAGFMTAADQPVHLLGHSYGAAVALQLALRWPERVASMTLYEPVRFALLTDVEGASAAEKARASEARYQITTAANRFSLAVMSGRREEAAERFVDFWGGPGSWAAMDQRHRQLQMAATPKVHAEYQALMADGVRGSAYESLTMPVHLIGGTSSPLPVREVMRRLAARVPHAATVSIIGLGHMGPVVAAGRVRAHLPEWLQAPERSAELQAA
ncbi:MAG TPA: alpha/beta hydrolase [Acetobacteraceae bacterium]|nr:alpha/beta hydrolase [Acetobacteraceae bacterium]